MINNDSNIGTFGGVGWPRRSGVGYGPVTVSNGRWVGEARSIGTNSQVRTVKRQSGKGGLPRGTRAALLPSE